MRALGLASLLLLSLPAFAGTPLDRFDAKAGLVQVTGVGEVPLYRVGDDDAVYVRVKVSDSREALFAVALSAPDYTISADLAKELKLKVKSGNKHLLNLKGKDNKFKDPGEIKQTTLKTFELGPLHVTDLTVTVSDDLGAVEGFPVEGVVSLAPFDNQLSWALLRSKGILKVGPASSGGELVGGVGGQALSYKSVARTKYKDKVRGYGVKGYTKPAPFIVPAAVGGQAVEASLGLYGLDCTLSPALTLADTPERDMGDARLTYATTTLAGATSPGAWFQRKGTYTLQLGPKKPFQAELCRDVLNSFDLAIDPVGRKIGLNPGKDARADITDTLMKEAVARTEKKPEPPKDGKEPASKKPDSKPWTALYKAQMAHGAYADAVTTAGKLTEIDARGCAGWQKLGDAQSALGQFDEAIRSFAKASQLYHHWWDLPVDQREKISKQIKKLETDAEKDEFEYVEQPSGCFTAEGDMALAMLAKGDLSGVATLYKEHLDLDPTVAVAAGNAALRSGDWAAASGPYRQAIKRETLGSPQLLARQGVALAELASGDWAAAEPAFQRLYDRSGVTFSTARRYVDGVRAARGQDAALAVARSLATSRPDLLGPQVIFYDEAKRAGDAAATAAAEKMVEATAATTWNDIESRLARVELYAWYRLSQGQSEEAVKLANSVLAERGDRPLAWLVLARASEAAGDTAKAAEQQARAMSFGANLPAYALLGR